MVLVTDTTPDIDHTVEITNLVVIDQPTTASLETIEKVKNTNQFEHPLYNVLNGGRRPQIRLMSNFVQLVNDLFLV